MSSRNCALLDRTDIIGRSGFRGAYWWATSKRSADPTTNGKARPAATGRAFDSNRQLALPATRPSAERQAAAPPSLASGWHPDANARDAAVAASLALQFGCPLETLQRAVLRDENGNASTPLGAAIDLIAADRGGRP